MARRSPNRRIPAPSSANPDAALIRLCEQYIAVEVAFRAIYDGPDAITDDDVAEVASTALGARENTLLDQMEALRAVTAEGVSARARVLAAHNLDFGFSFDQPDTMAGRLLTYLLRDAANLGGPIGCSVDSTDAALIAICTEAEKADDDSMEVSDSIQHLFVGDERYERGSDSAAILFAECRAGMNKAAATPFQTPDGLRAKASLALREMTTDDRDKLPLVMSVLKQAAGEPVTTPCTAALPAPAPSLIVTMARHVKTLVDQENVLDEKRVTKEYTPKVEAEEEDLRDERRNLAEQIARSKPTDVTDALIVAMHGVELIHIGHEATSDAETVRLGERAVRRGMATLVRELGVNMAPFGSENFAAEAMCQRPGGTAA